MWFWSLEKRWTVCILYSLTHPSTNEWYRFIMVNYFLHLTIICWYQRIHCYLFAIGASINGRKYFLWKLITAFMDISVMCSTRRHDICRPIRTYSYVWNTQSERKPIHQEWNSTYLLGIFISPKNITEK